MKRHIGLCTTLAATFLLMAASAALGQKQGRPPGWRGMSPQDQVAWGEAFRKAESSVAAKVAKKEGFTETDAKGAMDSLSHMTAAGVPISDAQDLVEGLLDRGFKGSEIVAISRTMSRGINEGLPASRVNHFILDRINEDLRGKELTDEINRAMDRALGR